MPRSRQPLPQLGRKFFLADGGMETTLVFLEGLELPEFASFPLVETPEGRASLRRYVDTYVDIAQRHAVGLVLETPTWRANPDWGAKLGYSEERLSDANRAAVALFDAVRRERETGSSPIVISGCIGPRGDGYIVGQATSAEAAADYHAAQIATFAETAADMVCGMTMNNTEEAGGIAMAARAAGIPAAISFTVETDGRLPSGQALGEAITQVDESSEQYPAYYMINCAHPSHFDHILVAGEPWVDRVRGLRANASRMSHAELDQAPELDAGDPVEFGAEHAALKRRLPKLTVLGGCCGTDHRHIEQVAKACGALFLG